MALCIEHPARPAVLQTDRFRLVADPAQGGRVVEFHDAALGRNLLLEPAPEGLFSFADGTAYPVAGWDEAIPTIEPSAGAPALGHAWRTRATCRVEASSLYTEWGLPGLTLRRRIRLSEEGLSAEYAVEAPEGEVPPLLWSAHTLYRIEGLREMVLPPGTPVPGPGCTLSGLAELLETQPETSRVPEQRPQGKSWKFFVRASRSLLLCYEDATLGIETSAPWFGVWFNTGLYRPPCVGIEPTNHPTDFLSDVDRSVEGLGAPSVAWRLHVDRP